MSTMSKLKDKIKKELQRFINRILKKLGIEPETSNTAQTDTDLFVVPDPANDNKKSGDEVDFSKLKWVYGGVDGSKAVEHAGVQIRNLRVTVGSKFSYAWARARFRRTLKEWGLADNDASALAVFGYKFDNIYKCGKMDWISTSRTSRSWKNIKDGYGGWNNNECSAASEFIFLILSKDGRKRSNVIRYKK